jgi:PIN domain
LTISQCFDLKNLTDQSWAEITNEKDISIVVPRTVIRQIDSLKNDGRERRRAKRARDAYRSLSRLALKAEGPHEVIRDSSPRLVLSVAFRLDPKRSKPADLDLESSDAKIVEETLVFIDQNPTAEVGLVSHDAGLLLLGREHGIQVFGVPESWFLPPEKDENSRQLENLEKRISLLEKKEPIVEIRVYRNEDPITDALELEVLRYRPLTDAEVNTLTASAKSWHPMKVDFAKDPPVPASFDYLRAMGGSHWYPLLREHIDKYQQTDYPAWLRQIREFFDNLHLQLDMAQRSTRVGFLIENIGSRPAEKAFVEFQIHGEAQFVPPKDIDEAAITNKLSLPRAPEPPKGRWTSPYDFGGTPSLSQLPSLRDLSQMVTHPKARDRYKFYWYPTKPKSHCDRWCFECEDFRHQTDTESFDIELTIPCDREIQDSMIECKVSAANLSQPVVKRVSFDITYRHEDTFAAAKGYL